MEHLEESALDLVEEGDLDVRLSVAFLISATMRSYLEIRDFIKGYLDENQSGRYIHGTGSSIHLYIIKEDDYKLLQEIKEKRRH